MTWQELVEIARTLTRDKAFELIDQWVIARPELLEAGNRAKALLDQLYAAAAVGETVTAAMGEIFALLQTGEGPVSNAPEIGLV